jgi:hypothetical protein
VRRLFEWLQENAAKPRAIAATVPGKDAWRDNDEPREAAARKRSSTSSQEKETL